MEEEGVDPSSVNKNPQVIKAAQEEISVLDVLVCGKCHLVFHFIEEFQDHKGKNECNSPVFKGNLSEPKPQVWAFLLWKSSQAKIEGDSADQVSSWKLYQKWCKMPDAIREAWIAAGKAIQVSSTLASAKMHEVKAPASKTPVRQQGIVRKVVRGRPTMQTVATLQTLTDTEKSENKVEKEEPKIEEVEVTVQENGGGDVLNVEIKEEQVSEAEADVAFEDEDEEEEERQQRLEAGESIEDIDKSIQRARHVVPSSILKKKIAVEGKVALHKKGSGTEDEYVVERIVSRRYNIRKKAYEYLLKWEGYPDDQNTWEPAENLADCKHLLESFECNLAKQKELQQLQGKDIKKGPSGLPPGPKVITAEISSPVQQSSFEASPSRGRPVRSSKKKAMDQVKAWCGSMSTRKLDDDIREISDLSEDEDRLSKRLKRSSESEDMSQYDGLSADELPAKRRKRDDEDFIVRRGPGRPRKHVKVNGDLAASSPSKEGSVNQDLAKSLLGEFITSLDGSTGRVVVGKKPDGTAALSPNQQPVLVANSKGVVKVDPRSMPNISSGVYIMTTTKSGATGSGLVKVEKIASTNVKVVTGPGQKSGGILAMKDAKAAGGETVEIIVPAGSSPTKPTILGNRKIASVNAVPALTPVKLMPKLVSPQVKGGLVKVTTTTSAAGSGVSPRPLIPASIRPGLVRTPVATRPTLLSPRVAGSPGQGGRGLTPIRPIRPKQALTVSGGKVVAAALMPGMKSGIRPIEAMLGTGGKSSTPSSAVATKSGETSVSPAAGEGGVLVKKDSTSLLVPLGSAKVKPEASRSVITPRGRGRGRGGRIFTEVRINDDKSQGGSDNSSMDFPEDRVGDADSDSDCGIPDDFPTGDLPPIEPDSPERPLTLCPLTGKILSRAEGEKTPPPTPPPEPVSSPKPAASSSTTTVLLGDEDGGETLIKVEMSPGGTTGTVVGDEATTLLRTSGGLTVKRMSANGSPGKSGNLLTTVTHMTNNNQAQGISLPARKLFTEESEEIAVPESELVTIQGPDGVMYQVHGQIQDGTQTLLVQGEDGEQRCVYVTTNQEGEDGATVLTLDSAYADAVGQLESGQVSVLGDGSQLLVHNEDGTTSLGDTQLMSVMEAGDKEDPQAQIVAQVVQAGEAPPGGGPRNVVLLLPDGNLMVTEVDEEQYAALELDK